MQYLLKVRYRILIVLYCFGLIIFHWIGYILRLFNVKNKSFLTVVNKEEVPRLKSIHSSLALSSDSETST
jgi:hypothetical protein